MNRFEFQNHSAYREVTDAFYKAMELMKKGTPPTEAVTKVAQDLGLNAQKTRRVAEAANTILTLNHFDNHPEKKGENFPIVDTIKAVKKLGLDFDKSATGGDDTFGFEQARIEKEVELDNYFHNKAWKQIDDKILDVMPEVDLFEVIKEAEAEGEKKEDPVVEVKKLTKQAEQDFYAYTHSQYELNTAIDSLTRIFSQTYPPDALELVKYAQRKYKQYNGLVAAVLKHVNAKATNFQIKTAEKLNKYTMQINYVDEASQEAFDSIIKHSCDLMQHYKTLASSCQKIDDLKKKD